MSDAEQDLGSDYDDHEEEDHEHKYQSPKQYSVSSNDEDDHMDGDDVILSPNVLGRDDDISSDDCEETKYDRGGDLSVFREIVNEERNDHYGSDSDEEVNHPQQDEDSDDDDEEEKENAYASNLQQMKKDFYERSKQLKHALTGIQTS